MSPLDSQGLESLIEEILEGKPASLAAALTQFEDTRPGAFTVQQELLARLEPRVPTEHAVVGLTGPPGVGKSSLAAALIRHWVSQKQGVGMVAVDPSSRRSGGALLGDRARLRIRPEERVFVRSMAARDQLGGLAPATRAAAMVLRAAFDWTLVETVGVGQSEVDVQTLADTVVLVLQPGAGDTLQFMKAGILEIPDVLVVHKWDLGVPAELTRAELEGTLARMPASSRAWSPPILGVSALSGEGVRDLVRALSEHRAHLVASGELETRRRANRVSWALDLYGRRYGTLGLERLGGPEEAERLAAGGTGTALDLFSQLASRAGLG